MKSEACGLISFFFYRQAINRARSGGDRANDIEVEQHSPGIIELKMGIICGDKGSSGLSWWILIGSLTILSLYQTNEG